MKKTIKTLLATTVLALSMVVGTMPAFAETVTSPENWNVTFTSNEKMETNFDPNEIDQLINNIQPGDTASISINLKNGYKGATDWYMRNQIIRSLEDSVNTANGGAYTYKLTYISPDNQVNTLYSSEAVGGGDDDTSRKGLNEVNDNGLDDYFMLGELKNGQSAKVELMVILEGETQGNNYQETLADLSMDFAVELVSSSPNRNPSYASMLQTGDQFLNNLPIFLGVACLGLIILILALIGRRKKKEQEEEGVQ